MDADFHFAATGGLRQLDQGFIVRQHVTIRSFTSALAVSTIAAVSLAVHSAPAASAAEGVISGSAYQDFGDDGTRTAASGDFGGDIAVAGVQIVATDASGTEVGRSQTGEDGTFSLAVKNAATDDVRVEFIEPAGFRGARVGPDNQSTVQYVQVGAAGVTVGLTQEDMVNAADGVPYVVVAEDRGVLDSGFIPGSSGAPSRTPDLENAPSLFGFPYTSQGHPVTSDRTILAVQGQTGTLWGAANAGEQYAFSGAFFRRGAMVGPGGLGAIYLTDTFAARSSNAPNAALLVRIPDAGDDPRPNPVPADYDWLHDPAAFPATGRIGLGDLEVSSDQKTLFAVNLNDRQLYAVPLTQAPGAAPIAGTPEAIPVPLALPGAAQACEQSAVMPFGLGTFQGDLYVTLTCTGPTDDDLRAYIYSMNTSTKRFSAEPAFEADLTFARPTSGGTSLYDADVNPNHYAAWSDDFALTRSDEKQRSQPLASSVSFDGTGDLALSIKDRAADQYAAELSSTDPADTTIYTQIFPSGDLLRACGNPEDGWSLENDGACGGRRSAVDEPNDWGPGGGQFYDTRFVGPRQTSWVHGNTLLGSSIQVPGYSNAMATLYDPIDYFSNGIRVLSNVDGRAVRNGTLESTALDRGTFHKSGGLGDLAALIDAAPVEIGNRVWLDADNDGLAEAGEQPIAGVTVNLYAADGVTLLATAVTDADGRYIFSSSSGTSTDASIYNLALQSETDYVVKIDNADDHRAGGPLSGLRSTLTTVGASTSVDSDGVDESPVITSARVSTPTPGSADHTFDFGFSLAYSLGNRLWLDMGAGDATDNGVFDDGEPAIVGALIELLDADGDAVLDADGTPLTTRTDDKGYYRFDNLAAGDYRIRVAASNFTSDGSLSGHLSSTGASTTFTADSNNTDKGQDSDDPATTGITSSTLTLARGTTDDVDPDTAGAGSTGPNGDEYDNLTADFGFIRPSVSVGDLVWLDENRDGRQDPDEQGLQNVVLTIVGPDGLPVTDVRGNPVGPVSTAADGSYSFDGLPLLPSGEHYTVRIDRPASGSVLAPYLPTAENVGDRAGDSSTWEATTRGLTRDGERDSTLDFGFVPALLAVGDLVWFDTDGDGRQTDAEPPAPGITVTLFNADGTRASRADGAEVESVRTDSTGKYVFDNLPAGRYYVEFTDLPAEHRFTRQGESGGADSNADAAGRTAVFTLTVGALDLRPVTDADGDLDAAHINPTIDAGITRTPSSPTPAPEPSAAIDPSPSPDPDPTPDPASAESLEPAGQLALTGGTPALSILALSLILLGIGSAFVLRGRRGANRATLVD